MADETYVTHGGWTQQPGRPDQIDEIADQFERPTVEAQLGSRELAGR